MFIRLRTVVYIVKQPLSAMLKIAALRGIEYWEEEEELMNLFSSMRKSGLRIKTTQIDALVKQKLDERRPVKPINVESGNEGGKKERW